MQAIPPPRLTESRLPGRTPYLRTLPTVQLVVFVQPDNGQSFSNFGRSCKAVIVASPILMI
jgi:hypothetical protein